MIYLKIFTHKRMILPEKYIFYDGVIKHCILNGNSDLTIGKYHFFQVAWSVIKTRLDKFTNEKYRCIQEK